MVGKQQASLEDRTILGGTTAGRIPLASILPVRVTQGMSSREASGVPE
jgi:hypothetical protein